MDDKKDITMEKVFASLNEVNLALSDSQKNKILENITYECENMDRSSTENTLLKRKLIRLVTMYPYRLAFLVSGVQTAVFTMIFGTNYTNLILSMFGGN